MNISRRILVCGVGSIGERHIKNLLTLGFKNIAVFRSRNLPLKNTEQPLQTFTDLSKALSEFRPDVVFITNPSSLHLKTAILAAKTNCHVFIEKPLSHTLDGIEDLEKIINETNKIAMIGYMLRYHPLLLKLKNWVSAGSQGPIGKVHYCRICWGEYLPDWHPWEDYKESYASRKELGGSPSLTLSHDLDILVWLLGIPKVIKKLSGTQTELKTDCPHMTDFLIQFENGCIANAHLDYFQRPPHRSFELVGSKGKAIFDYYSGTLNLWTHGEGDSISTSPPTQETFLTPENFDRNDLFMEEIRAFFDAIENQSTGYPTIADSKHVLKLAADS
ncbi:Gfo/Idh/MocA family oxidoreductase [Puniceicoccaceae bacterium K14]|nr:Gfo/Idh/MocA family oxidoreductase [Puniceicoccaceae bacterium K14]